MNVLLRLTMILLCFALGVLLILVPWSAFWERSYFLERYPLLIPYLLNPWLRGAVSGLGLLDVGIAVASVRRGRSPALAARS